tara:strand:+ start:262 stop:1074 length:813 start_codon:yes stop_codon:yes gene_type:complete
MKSLSEIRSINYKHRKDENEEFFVNIDDWLKSPYSSLKARYYIEVSSIIVYFLQFTKITPNQLSSLYAFLGLFSGFLISTNINSLIYSGLIIFFLKGVIDWSDGLLARITNKTSNIGHIVDTWGSHVGYFSLIFGLGMIAFNHELEAIYLIITVLIFLLSLLDFKLFSYHQLFYEILNNKLIVKKDNPNFLTEKKFKINFLKKYKIFLKYFLDDRARTLDLICLIAFLEIFYAKIIFTKIILVLFLIKKLIVFIGNFLEIVILKKLKDKI